MQEQPQAEVLVLLASQARLAVDRVMLPGGGSADVLEDDDGDQLVQVTGGRVRPDELVRAVLATPGFAPRGGLVDLVVVTDRGWDRHLLSEDLGTRLLHERHDDSRAAHGGRHVVVVGPPGGDPLAAPAPSAPATSVADLVRRSSRPVGRLSELPLVSDPVRAALGGRRAALFDECDLVVPSWGAVDPAFDVVIDDVRAALRAHRVGVLVRTRGDVPDAVGADRHPAARSDTGPGDGLVTAPVDWLWGAPLG